MVRLLALVEGTTERNFCQRILAPWLASANVSLSARVIGMPGHKGGVGSWDRAKREIIKLLRQERNSICTTMFDLYGLPQSWPGKAECVSTSLRQRKAAIHIEQKIHEAITAEIGDQARCRFIPYLSLHEYEALLFSDPAALASVTQNPANEVLFRKILTQHETCEDINDDPATAPSKRILKIASGYRKPVDGIIAAERIGLERMRKMCPHFDNWLKCLKSLGEK